MTTHSRTNSLPSTIAKSKNQKVSPLFLGTCGVAILIWGANWPVMKVGVTYIPPIWFAASRFLSASILAFLIAGLSGKCRLPARHEWPVVIGIGALQMGLFTALATGALHFVMPGRASLIAYATSVWVIPAAALILKHKMSRLQIIASACSFTGIAIVVLPAFAHVNIKAIIGFSMLAGASLSWAISIIQIKMTRNVVLDLSLLPWQTLVAAIPLTLVASLAEGAPHFLSNPHAWPIIAYTGPLATALTFLVVLQMTQRLAPITISVCMLGVPVVGITLSSILFHESLSLDLVAGLVLICLGMVIPALRIAGPKKIIQPIGSR